jgi:hypothetical protein
LFPEGSCREDGRRILDRALQFERMASYAEDAKLKQQLLQQCEAYRKLASKRAIEIGVPQEASKPLPE